ncbi:MAG: biopolymer transporter ExbB [Gammaproteobacteria bacterium]|nr:MotA/TolQ/ExbB proton channel family protein [Gammaproteobacteria bacterium]PCH63745.1 MAG: biopolymer transporter ExbB [Gammaproteobacteria bacterium]
MSILEQLFGHFSEFAAVRDFFELGGEVLFAIAILLLFMWLLIFERFFYLYSTHRKKVEVALAIWEARSERKSWHAHRVRERLISVVSQGLDRNLNILTACVALCPLLGLIGTVWGMIEVFDVMALSGSGNVRAMASGVSKATIPTMAGMVAALSGIAISTFLQARAKRERLLLGEHMTMDH